LNWDNLERTVIGWHYLALYGADFHHDDFERFQVEIDLHRGVADYHRLFRLPFGIPEVARAFSRECCNQ